MIKSKSKKGFTLIELIAVIAILAILGAILVPKIGGYSTKANAAKDLANAKMLVQAVEMYKVENNATVLDTVTLTSLKDNISKYTTWPTVNPKTATTSIPTPATWGAMTYAQLKTYAEELEASQ